MPSKYPNALRSASAWCACTCAFFLLLSSLLCPSLVRAQNWTGGGADNNWSTAANWSSGSPPAATSINFAGTTRLTPFNDTTAGTSYATFNFSSTAGAFVVSGNAVVLGGDATNSSATKETINLVLQLGSGTSRNFNIVNAAGELEISQGIANLSGTANLVKVGRGALTFTAANTYSGLTSVLDGTLTISGANGSMALGTGITVTNGATFRLSNTAAANNTARLADTQAVSLNGGNMQFINTGGAANYSETVGVLTLAGGVNTLTSSQADSGQTSEITFSSLSRTNGVVNFSGTGLGDDTRNRIVFISALNNDGIMGGYATVGNEFAKYDATVGSVRAMQAGDYITTDQDTWTATSNVKLTASPSMLSASRQINSLNLAPGSAFTMDLGGRTLRVESGGILFSGSQTAMVQHGTLSAGEGTNAAGNLVIHQNSSGMLTLGARITNNGTGVVSVTKAGTGGLTFMEDNTYTGATYIYAGSLRTGVSGALSASSALILGDSSGTAAALDTTGTSQAIGGLQVLANTTAVNAITVTAGETLTINGDVSIGGNVAASVTNTTMNGGGSLVINDSGGTFQLGMATGNISYNTAILDITGMSSFTANMGTASGVFRVGDNNTTGNVSASVLKLAVNSTITANRISVGGESGSGTQTISFGVGATVLNANTLDLGPIAGGARAIGVLSFATSSGTLKIRAADGVGAAVLNVGNSVVPSTAGSLGATFDSRGHNADLKLSALNVAGRSAGTGITTVTFDFDTGTLEAATVNLAQKLSTNTASGAIAGTMTLAGGTITLGTVNLASNTTNTGTASAILTFSGNNTTTIGSISMASATIAGGTATAVLNLNGGSITLNGAITRAGGAGTSTATVTLNGATLDMGGNAIGSLANAITFTAQSGILKNVASINGATGGLTKTGTGTLELQGSNGYGGATVISAGTLKIATLTNGGAASTLGSSSNAAANLVLNGGTLQYTGATTTTDRLFSVGTATGSVIDASGSGTVKLTNTGSMGFNSQLGARTLTLTGTNTGENSIAAVIGDNSGLTSVTKTGAGTWVLTGANTYAGTTTVNAGTLMLDFSAAGAPTSNILSSSSAISLGGGTLNIRGGSGSPTQTLASLALTAGANTLSLTPNGATSLVVTLNGASISRTAGSTLNLVASGTASFNATNALNNSAGILGGYAVFNAADWATRDVSGNLVAFSNYTALPTTGGDTATNYLLTSGTSLTGALTVNSLKITGTGVTLDGNTRAITFSGTSGGLLYAPALSSDTYSITGSGVVGAGTANEFIVQVSQGRLSIANPVVSSTATAGSLTKAGDGTLVLTGTSLFTGATNVNGGTLEISGTGTLSSSTGNITVGAGATLRVNSTNAAQAIADSTDVAVAGTFEVRANETLGGLSGLGTLRNGGSSNAVLTAGNGNETSNFSGLIQDGSTGTLGITKAGTGVLTFDSSLSNTYTGTTTINAGTLSLAKTGGAIAVVGNITVGDGSGSTADILLLSGSEQIQDTAVVTLTGNSTVAGTGTFRLNGNTETIGGLSSAGGTQNGVVENALASTTGKLIVNTTSDQSFTGVMQNGSGTSSVLVFTKVGAAQQTLAGTAANTYTGVTTVLGGTLRLNKTAGINAIAGSLSIGDGTASAVVLLAAANQIADTTIATLAGTGATAGVLRLAGNSETLAGISSNALVGGGVLENESGVAGTATLTVNVADSTTQTFTGVVRDGDGVGTDGALALVKSGTGVQVMSGDNTYSGGTTINAGTLVTGGVGSGQVVNNGTLVINRTSEGTLAQAMTGTGSLILGSSGTVVLSGNSNTYSGGTIVDQGTLRVMNSSGSATGTGAVTIANGATLSGTGLVGGATSINVGGTLSVGYNGSAGQTMTLNGGLFSAGSLQFDLWGNAGGVNPGTNADLLIVGGGAVTLSGTLQVTSNGISSWAVGDSWKLIDWGTVLLSDRTVVFDTFVMPTLSGGLTWDTSQLGQTGYIAIAPEPGRMLLLMVGLVMLGLRRKRSATGA